MRPTGAITLTDVWTETELIQELKAFHRLYQATYCSLFHTVEYCLQHDKMSKRDVSSCTCEVADSVPVVLTTHSQLYQFRCLNTCKVSSNASCLSVEALDNHNNARLPCQLPRRRLIAMILLSDKTIDQYHVSRTLRSSPRLLRVLSPF